MQDILLSWVFWRWPHVPGHSQWWWPCSHNCATGWIGDNSVLVNTWHILTKQLHAFESLELTQDLKGLLFSLYILSPNSFPQSQMWPSRKGSTTPSATSYLESSVPKRHQWPANFIENNKCKPHMQSKCVPNNQLNSCAKTTMTGTTIILNLSFCLSCTEHPFKCKDFRVACLPSCIHIVFRKLIIYGLHETVSGGSGNLTHLALLTMSNHRTLDRSFHNITSDFKPVGHKLQGERIQYRMIDHPYQLDASLLNNLRIQSQCIIQQFSSPAENRSAPAVAWQILRTGLLWLRCCSVVAGEVANVFFDEKKYSL